MGSMHLYFPKGRMPAWRPPLMRLFLAYILHHVLHTALQQPAELVDGVGRYVAAVLHGVKVRQREAQLYCWTQTRALFILKTRSPAMTLMGGLWSSPGTSCPASLPGPEHRFLQRQRKRRESTPSRKSDAPPGKQRRNRPGRDGRGEARSKIAVAPKERIPIYNKQKPAHGQPCAGFAMERRDVFGLHNTANWFT